MAFKAGALSVTTNFDMKYSGPVDSRQVCDFYSDLLIVPFPYMGMLVSVVGDEENNGVYALKALPATEANNWVKIVSL